MERPVRLCRNLSKYGNREIKENKNKIILADLPNFILLKIFKYADINTIYNLALTSKQETD